MHLRKFAVVIFLSSCALFAQKWEVGAAGGGSFYTSQTLTNPSDSADATFNMAIAASAWLGNDSGKYIGGEVRYDYEASEPQLKGDGATVTFGGHTQAVHYDFLFHFTPRSSRVRPFVAAGAGIKVYSGTGQEQAFQPLQDVALLTRTQDLTPMISAGAGVKVAVTSNIQLRLEVHDFMTPFPKQVIVPNTGTTGGGWFHNIVPMFGISFTF
jgi:outer membrane protein W